MPAALRRVACLARMKSGRTPRGNVLQLEGFGFHTGTGLSLTDALQCVETPPKKRGGGGGPNAQQPSKFRTLASELLGCSGTVKGGLF